MKAALYRAFEERAKRSRRIYIVPTKNGFLYIGVNFTLFLMGLVYANNLVLLLSFSLFAAFLLIMFNTHALLENYEPGKISVKSGSIEDSPGIYIPSSPELVRFQLKTNKGKISLLPAGTDRGLHRTPKMPRGRYNISHLNILTKGVAGFFLVWTYRPVGEDMFIYPSKAPGNLPEELSQRQTLAGSGEFHKHSPYTKGHSARRIDWKAYARARHLLIKEYEDALNEGALIDLDSLSAEKEMALSLAAWAVDQSFRRGVPWEIKGKGLHLPHDGGAEHRRKTMEALSEA